MVSELMWLLWFSRLEKNMADVCSASVKCSPAVVSDSPITDPGSSVKVCLFNILKSNCYYWT
jgi:hypothetical protein